MEMQSKLHILFAQGGTLEDSNQDYASAEVLEADVQSHNEHDRFNSGCRPVKVQIDTSNGLALARQITSIKLPAHVNCTMKSVVKAKQMVLVITGIVENK